MPPDATINVALVSGAEWIYIFGAGGSNSNLTAVHLYKSDGTSFQANGQSWNLGSVFATGYYVMLDPVARSFYLWTSYQSVATAQFNGHILIGAVLTTDSSGNNGVGYIGNLLSVHNMLRYPLTPQY